MNSRANDSKRSLPLWESGDRRSTGWLWFWLCKKWAQALYGYKRWNISNLSFILRELSLTFFFFCIRSRASLADPANWMPSITTGDFGGAVELGEAGAGAEAGAGDGFFKEKSENEEVSGKNWWERNMTYHDSWKKINNVDWLMLNTNGIKVEPCSNEYMCEALEKWKSEVPGTLYSDYKPTTLHVHVSWTTWRTDRCK